VIRTKFRELYSVVNLTFSLFSNPHVVNDDYFEIIINIFDIHGSNMYHIYIYISFSIHSPDHITLPI
jgi:hypothetical protein